MAISYISNTLIKNFSYNSWPKSKLYMRLYMCAVDIIHITMSYIKQLVAVDNKAIPKLLEIIFNMFLHVNSHTHLNSIPVNQLSDV